MAGMLDRYRKSGGFLQLVNLIETCGKEKQEKLLATIKVEDPAWEEMIRAKLLSVQRVLGWNTVYIGEVVARMSAISLSTMLHGIPEEKWDTVLGTMTQLGRRQIEEAVRNSKPSLADVSTSLAKFLNEARQAILSGTLRLEKVDPELAIEEGIEEKIGHNMGLRALSAIEPADAISEEGNTLQAVDMVGGSEIMDLRRKVQHLEREKAILKRELRIAQEKLEQIRKIA
jgi:hypothetical protein